MNTRLAVRTAAFATIAIALVTLTGCGGLGDFSFNRLNPWGGAVERSQTLPSDATVYACADGKRLVVRPLAGTASVMVVFREREFRLDPASAAPGSFSNGSTTLATNEGVTTLQEDGAVTHTNCRRPAG